MRVYGELADTRVVPFNATWTDVFNDWRNGTANVSITPRPIPAGAREVFAPDYPGFDLRVTEQLRVDRFLNDFRRYVKNGNLPDLVVLYLPTDHTAGTAPGYPTPRAMVADNDLGLGRVVQAISTSRYWRQSAIFVTEDDAQDGLDHVDGHRTVGLVISPYARRGAVDSTLYTTNSMFRTIEQILGLPPLTQYDLGAQPMTAAFDDRPDYSAYKPRPNGVPLNEMNPPLTAVRGQQRRLAQACAKMDFSTPDAAPEELLNRAIWHSVRGFRAEYPGVEEATHERD